MSEANLRAVRPLWVCAEDGITESMRVAESRDRGQEPDEQVCAEAELVADEIETIDEEGENGHRKVRHMLDPTLPSAAEVREHRLTHLPYRSWCYHCVRGRGKEMNHEKQKNDGEQNISEYHMDYCFPGDENGQKLIILLIIEKFTKMKKAVVVPSKDRQGSSRPGEYLM